MKKTRGFEVAKGWEDKNIHIPERRRQLILQDTM